MNLEDLFNNGSFPLEKVVEFRNLLDVGSLASAYQILQSEDSEITYSEFISAILRPYVNSLDCYVQAESERRYERREDG